MKANPNCRVCLGPRHRLIHAATLRLHAWWRERLLLAISPPASEGERPRGTRQFGVWGEAKRGAGA